MKYMYKDKYEIYDSKGKFLRYETLCHEDGGKYKKLEPFEKRLLKSEEYGVLYSSWSSFTGKWIKQ